jgi:cytochrome c553
VGCDVTEWRCCKSQSRVHIENVKLRECFEQVRFVMGLILRRGQPISLNDKWLRGLIRLAGSHLILQTAILAIAFTTASRADDTVAAGVSKHDFQAKLDYCKTCHGSSGQGFRAYYPIPRLAGQQAEYLMNQLRAFSEGRRKNNIMFNVAHVLSPAMQKALVTNFHELNPKPLGGAPKELVAAGKKIYEAGSNDIPPCASCHGPDAKGNEQFPRLAGQLHDYVFNKLTNWSKERGQNPAEPDTSAIMEPIAHGLTEPQIKAIAAYVSNLE